LPLAALLEQRRHFFHCPLRNPGVGRLRPGFFGFSISLMLSRHGDRVNLLILWPKNMDFATCHGPKSVLSWRRKEFKRSMPKNDGSHHGRWGRLDNERLPWPSEEYYEEKKVNVRTGLVETRLRSFLRPPHFSPLSDIDRGFVAKDRHREPAHRDQVSNKWARGIPINSRLQQRSIAEHGGNTHSML
jgi:hypothetical protein